MNKRRETLLFAAILIGAIVVSSTVVPMLLGGTGSDRKKGDPVDATGKAPEELLQESSAPKRGSSIPKYTLIEFGDFACPSCLSAQSVVRDLMQQHRDLRLIFRQFPMVHLHPNALPGARAAIAAGLRDKFWEMHDLLFERQIEWKEAADVPGALAKLAASIGLDARRFIVDLKSNGEVDKRLAVDHQIAEACSVNSTPSFFLITPTHIWAAVGPIGLERMRDGSKYWQ